MQEKTKIALLLEAEKHAEKARLALQEVTSRRLDDLLSEGDEKTPLDEQLAEVGQQAREAHIRIVQLVVRAIATAPREWGPGAAKGGSEA